MSGFVRITSKTNCCSCHCKRSTYIGVEELCNLKKSHFPQPIFNKELINESSTIDIVSECIDLFWIAGCIGRVRTLRKSVMFDKSLNGCLHYWRSTCLGPECVKRLQLLCESIVIEIIELKMSTAVTCDRYYAYPPKEGVKGVCLHRGVR
ncbi:hypothetical protein NPIL_235071 [Nephila pilipes]|uniref:Uncharacterized protein n=1 Tax=Nephila pilipes TaxID=299642 RepID=A0A8X6I3N2_NEPPI|nr:hypothetical protein NPIL_235071 [Nephila pilipes]